MISQETLRRLKRRSHKDEQTADETVNRLLDETIVEIDLAEIVETAIAQFEHVSCVRINHRHPSEDGSLLGIRINSGDVITVGEPVKIYGPEHRAVITDADSDESRRYQFFIEVSSYLPVANEMSAQTPVYVKGTRDPDLELDVGLKYLRQKLLNPDDWTRSHCGRRPHEIQAEYE